MEPEFVNMIIATVSYPISKMGITKMLHIVIDYWKVKMWEVNREKENLKHWIDTNGQ